jgi:hypothetical protein
MMKCGDFTYDMIDGGRQIGIENAVILKATIDSIDRVNNIADIVYDTDCEDLDLAEEDVEFFYHCQYSTGNEGELIYGNNAFLPDDEVYVIHIPGTDDKEAETFIIGHTEIENTKPCTGEVICVRLMAFEYVTHQPDNTYTWLTVFDSATGELVYQEPPIGSSEVTFPVRQSDFAAWFKSLYTPVTAPIGDYWHRYDYEESDQTNFPWTKNLIRGANASELDENVTVECNPHMNISGDHTYIDDIQYYYSSESLPEDDEIHEVILSPNNYYYERYYGWHFMGSCVSSNELTVVGGMTTNPENTANLFNEYWTPSNSYAYTQLNDDGNPVVDSTSLLVNEASIHSYDYDSRISSYTLDDFKVDYADGYLNYTLSCPWGDVITTGTIQSNDFYVYRECISTAGDYEVIESRNSYSTIDIHNSWIALGEYGVYGYAALISHINSKVANYVGGSVDSYIYDYSNRGEVYASQCVMFYPDTDTADGLNAGNVTMTDFQGGRTLPVGPIKDLAESFFSYFEDDANAEVIDPADYYFQLDCLIIKEIP